MLRLTFLDFPPSDFLFFPAGPPAPAYPAPDLSFLPPSLFRGFFADMASSRHSRWTSSEMRRHFFSRSLSFSFSCRNRSGGPKGRGHRGEGVRARESAIFFVAGGRWRAEHSPGRRPPTASESEARAGSQCTHLSQAPSLRERKGAARAVRNRNGGRRRREARWSATEKEENMGGRARGGGARGAPSNARETWSRPGRSTKWRRRTHRPPSGSSLALAFASEDLFSPF